MVDIDGTSLSVTEAGSGPLVVLLHGFPELAFSWRHQIRALVDAGYRVIAPDQRGYGKSDIPSDVGDYNIFDLVGDVAGLVARFHQPGDTAPVVVGHDWGAIVAWHCALFRPDLFRGVAAMSVPYMPRGTMSVLDLVRSVVGDGFNYMLYFQEPGVAEAELRGRERELLHRMMWGASGDRPPETVANPNATGLLDGAAMPEGLPPWLSQEEFDVYVEAFERSGFTGPINWYRNLDNNHRMTAPWTGAKVSIPALFVGGLSDFVVNGTGALNATEEGPTVTFMRSAVDELQVELLERVGHWNQQEAPDATNAALIGWLDRLA